MHLESKKHKIASHGIHYKIDCTFTRKKKKN